MITKFLATAFAAVVSSITLALEPSTDKALKTLTKTQTKLDKVAGHHTAVILKHDDMLTQSGDKVDALIAKTDAIIDAAIEKHEALEGDLAAKTIAAKVKADRAAVVSARLASLLA